MYRFTTPTLVFRLPISTELLDQAIVTLYQTNVLIEKSLDQMTLEDNILKVQLTQEETGQLRGYNNCLIQLRVRCKDGSAFVSQQFREKVLDVIKEGVI